MSAFFLPLLLLLSSTTTTTAHFLLNSPASIGFNDDLEGTPPCGSFTPDFSHDNVSTFHVAGDSIALTSTHPAATWLFRATLDLNPASGNNWTSLRPPVAQTGLGDYCEQDLSVPGAWAGQKGVVGVVQDAADGLLYQCAAVNFVSGTAPSPPTACKNATGLSAAYTADAALSSVPASATASETAAGSTTATAATSPSGSSSAKTSGGVREGGWSSGVMGLALILVVAGVMAGGI